MKLLIDIGNSRIKSATSEGGVLSSLPAVAWAEKKLSVLFDDLWDVELKPSTITVSCVAGIKLQEALTDWCCDKWGVRPFYIYSEASYGRVRCAYPDPTQLGVDRWAAVLGAAQLTSSSVLIVDCGTATTVDLLAADGQHQGGAILPGINTMRRALAGDTAALNVPAGDIVPFADNTGNAIASGTAYAVAACIDRYVNEARKICQDDIKILLTGGEAVLVQSLLVHISEHVPELVLIGLGSIEKKVK